MSRGLPKKNKNESESHNCSTREVMSMGQTWAEMWRLNQHFKDTAGLIFTTPLKQIALKDMKCQLSRYVAVRYIVQIKIFVVMVQLTITSASLSMI